MDGYLIDGKTVTAAELEALKAEQFGDALTVSQPWTSHGPVLQIGGIAYFKGNAKNPNDPCGNDNLSMALHSMTPAGVCPVDGAQSFYLVPDDDTEGK